MRIISVGCARPNFVKLAAVHHAFEQCKSDSDEHFIIHTGQHYDPLFSDIFFEQLQIPLPDVNLGIAGGTREEVIAKTSSAIKLQLQALKPDCLLVYGDVNGAVGAALATQELGIPIAHIEAGLRSFDTEMPEEINRIAIDQIADFLYCTEQSALDNIKKESITGNVQFVGNTMIDTLVRMLKIVQQEHSPFNSDEPYSVVTLHRPSNVDTKEDLELNINFLNHVASIQQIVLPVHHRLQSALEKFNLTDAFYSNVHLLSPLGYIPFLKLLTDCACVITDSGGIQEEMTFLKKRCFTIRRNTERPSTIEAGSNTLINPAVKADIQIVEEFLTSIDQQKITIPEYWDGKTGGRIVQHLQSQFNV